MDDAVKLFAAIQHATNIEQEIKSLEILEDYLLSLESCGEGASDDVYLNTVQLGNRHCPEAIFTSQDALNRFVCYVFVRRFGWSDQTDEVNNGDVMLSQALKLQINTLLSNIIEWFQEDILGEAMFQSLIHTLKHAQHMPVVRSQTSIHAIDWIKQSGYRLKPDIYDTAKVLILMSLTDVWSPIRSACVSRLSLVIEKFDLGQVESFFRDLISICQDECSSWQAREGAVMGMTSIIRKFQWVGILVNEEVVSPLGASQCEFILKFGMAEFIAMPEFISAPLGEVIYKLLSNSQLSIREHAIKCYSAYLGRCELTAALQTFEEIMKKLNPSNTDINDPQVFLQEFAFLSDFEAEGLLGVCVHLVKQIPSERLYPIWLSHFLVFSMYLGHHACTVRQVTSTIFKFIVAKDSSNPSLLKSVLHRLSSPWQPNMEFLSHDCLNTEQMAAPTPHITMRKWLTGSRSVEQISAVWEWREGRLLAYELILQFLIKNHWLYTFGSANLNALSSPRSTDNVSSSGDLSLKDGLKVYNSMNSERQQRRGSCSPPPEDGFLRPRTSSESFKNRSVSASIEVPTKHPNHCHCSHHRLTGVSTTSNSLGSAQDMNRVPTMYGCGAASVKSFGRHYSYYSREKLSVKPSHSIRTHSASSLLALCLDQEYLSNGIEATLDTPNLSNVLRHILLQCIESTADSRWELRRMGQQLLPCVVEVMRWFNITLIEDFLDKHMTQTSSILTYGTFVCLKHSLSHAASLQWLIQQPPTSWQDVRLCQKIIQSIIRCIKRRIPDWLLVVKETLNRPIIDKLTVLAMEVILITIGHFEINNKDKRELTEMVVGRLVLVYLQSHPSDILSASLHNYNTLEALTITTDGFLGCKGDAPMKGRGFQAECYMLSEVHPSLRRFVDSAPVDAIAVLFPLLCSWFGIYLEDDNLIKHLQECISSLCSQIILYSENNEHNKELSTIQGHSQRALKELVHLASFKSLDQQSLKQVLDLCLCFVRVLPAEGLVQDLLRLAATNMLQLSECKPGSGSHKRAAHEEENMYLHCNDVQVLATALVEGPSSDEDEHLVNLDAEASMPETQILNLSGNSGHSASSRKHSRRDSANVDDDVQSDDDSSDWDDWDEDQSTEDNRGKELTLKEFVMNLQAGLCKTDNNIVMATSLKQFSKKEADILKTLLTS